MVGKRDSIDNYISECTKEVIPLLAELRGFVHDTLPGATEGMQYGVPVFLNAHGVPVIYLFGSKRHVKLGFLRSAELDDPDGVLRGSGKPTKHVKIVPWTPLNKKLLTGLVNQCQDMRQ